MMQNSRGRAFSRNGRQAGGARGSVGKGARKESMVEKVGGEGEGDGGGKGEEAPTEMRSKNEKPITVFKNKNNLKNITLVKKRFLKKEIVPSTNSTIT